MSMIIGRCQDIMVIFTDALKSVVGQCWLETFIPNHYHILCLFNISLQLMRQLRGAPAEPHNPEYKRKWVEKMDGLSD